MSDDEGLDYASSGVDIELEGEAIASLIGSLGASARPPGTVGAPVELPGGFGGLVEFGDNLLALATDGVGSKLQLATALGEYGGVGIDCMAMNVNDLICVGAEPIAFVDYIATPKPDAEVHAALGASLAEACRLARVTLAGGETASLPGIVKELDLSGTALGWLPKEAAITGENITGTDVLIGLPSNGIHSNGYSLVRRLLEVTGAELTDAAPFPIRTPLSERCCSTRRASTSTRSSTSCSPAARVKARVRKGTSMESPTSPVEGCPTSSGSTRTSDGTSQNPSLNLPSSTGSASMAKWKPERWHARSTSEWGWRSQWISPRVTLSPTGSTAAFRAREWSVTRVVRVTQ